MDFNWVKKNIAEFNYRQQQKQIKMKTKAKNFLSTINKKINNIYLKIESKMASKAKDFLYLKCFNKLFYIGCFNNC